MPTFKVLAPLVVPSALDELAVLLPHPAKASAATDIAAATFIRRTTFSFSHATDNANRSVTLPAL
jgi:hypothetical protein